MKNKFFGVVLMFLLAAPVRGQTPEAAGCEAKAQCVALYEQAQQQSKAGQLAEAEKSYRLAYEVSHDARLLFNIARVLDKRGQKEEALSTYRQFLDAPVADEAQKAKAREFVAQLEGKREDPSSSSGGVPVYKKGWFWGVLIGSTVAVGLGIGLGVGLSRQVPMVPSGTNTIAF